VIPLNVSQELSRSCAKALAEATEATALGELGFHTFVFVGHPKPWGVRRRRHSPFTQRRTSLAENDLAGFVRLGDEPVRGRHERGLRIGTRLRVVVKEGEFICRRATGRSVNGTGQFSGISTYGHEPRPRHLRPFASCLEQNTRIPFLK